MAPPFLCVRKPCIMRLSLAAAATAASSVAAMNGGAGRIGLLERDGGFIQWQGPQHHSAQPRKPMDAVARKRGIDVGEPLGFVHLVRQCCPGHAYTVQIPSGELILNGGFRK